ILAEAKRLAADMIVMGSHGHGALYRALLGSVSEGVLHKATCPLTIVPGRATAD
ncbi:MAG: universal stress protein, partial [Deltaproteobacteria bacterium]|nr:universal stress protein [Deltaproteobacteria bacterium]